MVASYAGSPPDSLPAARSDDDRRTVRKVLFMAAGALAGVVFLAAFLAAPIVLMYVNAPLSDSQIDPHEQP